MPFKRLLCQPSANSVVPTAISAAEAREGVEIMFINATGNAFPRVLCFVEATDIKELGALPFPGVARAYVPLPDGRRSVYAAATPPAALHSAQVFEVRPTDFRAVADELLRETPALFQDAGLWYSVARDMEDKRNTAWDGVHGRGRSPLECYAVAAALMPDAVSTWYRLSRCLYQESPDRAVTIKGVEHTWRDCMGRALSEDNEHEGVWGYLAKHMDASDTVIVDGTERPFAAVLGNALGFAPTAKLWRRGAELPTGVVVGRNAGKLHTRLDCLAHAASLDDSLPDLWCELGAELGNGTVTVGDEELTADDCYSNALAIDPTCTEALNALLGTCVDGRKRGAIARALARASSSPRKSHRAEVTDSAKCVVCMERARDTVLRPCKHMCVCNECANKCTKCPMCRSRVAEKLSVFT